MGCSAEPVRLAHWEEYVRRVAERYKGKVTDYELWNEPKFMDFERDRKQYAAGGVFFYTGNIASMVEMAKAARRVLDQVDPEARLFTPGFVNGTDRLDAFLAQGGAQYVQGVAYHFYDFSSVDSLFFLKEALEVKAIMRKHGLAGLPLWNTETGVETDFGEGIPGRAGEGHSEETATWKMGQLMILAAFSGVDRYFYYAWDNDKSGMVMRDGALRPRHAAYGRLKNWLSGITTQSCSAKGGVVMCSARKAEREFMFVWADKLVDGDIDVPSGRRLTSVESTSGAPLAYSYVRGGVVRLSVSRDPIRLAFE